MKIYEFGHDGMWDPYTGKLELSGESWVKASYVERLEAKLAAARALCATCVMAMASPWNTIVVNVAINRASPRRIARNAVLAAFVRSAKAPARSSST